MTKCETTVVEPVSEVTITEEDNEVCSVTDNPETIIQANYAEANKSFLALSDTPSTYTSGYIVKVNASGDALEFVTPQSIEDINWGEITGSLSDQTDLQDALDLKYDLADFSTDFDTQFSGKDTGDLVEGVNLYYTDARAVSALSSHTGDTSIHFEKTDNQIDYNN